MYDFQQFFSIPGKKKKLVILFYFFTHYLTIMTRDELKKGTNFSKISHGLSPNKVPKTNKDQQSK